MFASLNYLIHSIFIFFLISISLFNLLTILGISYFFIFPLAITVFLIQRNF